MPLRSIPLISLDLGLRNIWFKTILFVSYTDKSSTWFPSWKIQIILNISWKIHAWKTQRNISNILNSILHHFTNRFFSSARSSSVTISSYFHATYCSIQYSSIHWMNIEHDFVLKFQINWSLFPNRYSDDFLPPFYLFRCHYDLGYDWTFP